MMPTMFREFPKYVPGPDGPVIVANAEEERRIRGECARNLGRTKANAAQRARADHLATELTPTISTLRVRGHSFRAIANHLNRQGIPSARGRGWGPGQVLRLLRRDETNVATGEKPASGAGSGAARA